MSRAGEAAAGPVIAIDGPSGSGKSTVGRRVAQALGFDYIDTGAMYRAVALRVLAEAEPEAALGRAGALAAAARIETRWNGGDGTFSIFLDGRDVSRAVRSPEATSWSPRVAAVPAVREVMVRLQRAWTARGGVVLEGRDIGTVVCPDARFKFYLDADLGERGRRRGLEEQREATVVGQEMALRDRSDASRPVAPLKAAVDALILDTTALTIEAVVERVLERIRSGGRP